MGGSTTVTSEHLHAEMVCRTRLLWWSRLWWEIVPRGLRRKETILTFQRYVILDAKRQQTGSVKVKIDLC